MSFKGIKDVRALAFLALMLVQAACAAFFLVDITHDIRMSDYTFWQLVMELTANLGLVLAVVVEAFFFSYLLRRQAEADRTISVASGALDQVIQDYYRQWGLTPTEADVASFTIKGFSIAEVARMRGSAEGTIKNHLNAVYRKSGLTGRGQLVSLLIEDLLNGRLSDGHAARERPVRQRAAGTGMALGAGD